MQETGNVKAGRLMRSFLFASLGLLILSLAANAWLALRNPSPSAVLSLEMNGDVEEVVVLPTRGEKPGQVRAVVGNRAYTAYRVSDVLSHAGTLSPSRLTFIGDDGRMASIDVQDALEDSYFAFSGSGLQFVSGRYPVNTWIKELRSVIVQSAGPRRVRVTSDAGDLAEFTPGDALASSHAVVTRIEGRSSMESNGGVHEGSVLSRHRLLDLHALAGVDPRSAMIAVGADGSILNAAGGRLAAGRNYVYLYHPGATSNVPLTGLVVEPPAGRVTDLFGEVLDLVTDGQRVMAIMIDGIGHIQFASAMEQRLVPTLASGEKSVAMTVYPPITPVATAAMLTGRTPDQNGIQNRGHRQIRVPTVFDLLREADKRGLYIQGSVSVLDLGDELIINSDRNGDGSADDEVLDRALKEMAAEPDFMFVHFKSTDYAGHKYGPLARETMERLAIVDGYISALLGSWNGPAIILSDHGMRMTEDGGHHGELRCEDMFVPYIRFVNRRPR